MVDEVDGVKRLFNLIFKNMSVELSSNEHASQFPLSSNAVARNSDVDGECEDTSNCKSIVYNGEEKEDNDINTCSRVGLHYK